MKKNIFIFLLIVVNAIVIIYYFKLNSFVDHALNKRDYNSAIVSDLKFSMSHNAFKVDSSLTLRDVSDSVASLGSLTNNKRVLICRYSYIHCNSCVDSLLSLVNNFAHEVGYDKVLILSQYANRRDYVNFIRINKIKYKIYDVRDTLNVLDTYDQPYLFVLEDDMIANNFYIPRKEAPDYVRMYLSSIKNLLIQE